MKYYTVFTVISTLGRLGIRPRMGAYKGYEMFVFCQNISANKWAIIGEYTLKTS